MKRNTYSMYGVVATLFVGIVLLANALRPHPTSFGPLESISSIPFPQKSGVVQIYEDLAHSDVYLARPTVGRTLHLTVTFVPHTTKTLAVSIREDSFWFSYQRQIIYEASGQTDNVQPQTREITLPLTAAFREADGSVDLMFFADTGAPDNNPLEERVHWEILELKGLSTWSTPSWAELSNYFHEYAT